MNQIKGYRIDWLHKLYFEKINLMLLDEHLLSKFIWYDPVHYYCIEIVAIRVSILHRTMIEIELFIRGFEINSLDLIDR